VLSGVLLGIIAAGFILTYNLNPIAQQEEKPLLGIVVQKPKPLQISAKYDTKILDEHNQAIEMKLGKLGKGQSNFVIADVNNESDQTQSLILSAKIPTVDLQQTRYDLLINSDTYLIYDDQGDKQISDLKIDIKAGESVKLNLKVTAYTNIAYPIELTAQLNH
jgi:hypothetical protein